MITRKQRHFFILKHDSTRGYHALELALRELNLWPEVPMDSIFAIFHKGQQAKKPLHRHISHTRDVTYIACVRRYFLGNVPIYHPPPRYLASAFPLTGLPITHRLEDSDREVKITIIIIFETSVSRGRLGNMADCRGMLFICLNSIRFYCLYKRLD